MTPFLIVLGVVALIAFVVIGIYNGLVGKRQRCNQAFADIDVQLKQRQNLIPNLVETVKGYASHEKETLDAVIKARQSAVSASTPGDMAAAENVLSASLGRLFALAEAYPDLNPREREQKVAEEHGAVFIIGIGGELADGEPQATGPTDPLEHVLDLCHVLRSPGVDETTFVVIEIGLRSDSPIGELRSASRTIELSATLQMTSEAR